MSCHLLVLQKRAIVLEALFIKGILSARLGNKAQPKETKGENKQQQPEC